MALTTIQAPFNSKGPVMTPISGSSPWTTIVTAHASGGLQSQDAATITNPTTEIIDTTKTIFNRRSVAGTLLRLRMGYDDGLSTITDPIIKVFGRWGENGVWQILENKNGNINQAISTDPTNDVTDGALKYTHPDPAAHSWDCEGCEEILVGVETALAGTGDTTNAILQARFI